MKPPADLEGPIKAESASLTAPRRRSATGVQAGQMPAISLDAHDHSNGHVNDHSSASCCGHSQQHGLCGGFAGNFVAAGGHVHSPVQAAAPQQQSPGTAAGRQNNLARGSSLGLVTTRIHAAAICCEHPSLCYSYKPSPFQRWLSYLKTQLSRLA